jgi:DNA polymerase III gamma/tau subunit
VAADAGSLRLLSRAARGSMRDALSLLDRLLASGEKKLTTKILEDLLGLPARDLVSNLLDAFVNGEPAAALKAGDTLLQRGISIDQIFESLLERLRDLLVLSTCGDKTDLVELSDDARKAEAARASKFDPASIVHMIAMLESLQRSAKNSAAPRALFDACLVRLALTDRLAELGAERPIEIHLGDPRKVLDRRPLATTFAPVPGWRHRANSMILAEVHPWPWLQRPGSGSVASFSAWSNRR